MKDTDWTAYADHGPREDEHPIVIVTPNGAIHIDMKYDSTNPGPGRWTHWMPYVPPREPDTALSLLREIRRDYAGVDESVMLRINTFLDEDDS